MRVFLIVDVITDFVISLGDHGHIIKPVRLQSFQSFFTQHPEGTMYPAEGPMVVDHQDLEGINKGMKLVLCHNKTS
jgi:hypothetical protein